MLSRSLDHVIRDTLALILQRVQHQGGGDGGTAHDGEERHHGGHDYVYNLQRYYIRVS